MKEFLELPLNALEYDLIFERKFGDSYYKLCPLLNYLMTGRAKLDETISKLVPIFSRISEGASTMSASCADINDIMDRSFKASFKRNSKKHNFRQMGKLGKTIVVLLLIAAVVGAGIFLYRFIHRSVVC